VLTPRQAESDFNNDQLTAIRAYFTRRLRRGDRSIDAHFQYLPFDQEPPIPVHADNVLVVIKECRAAWMEVELDRGKWEFKTPESKASVASSDEAHKLCDTCHGCGGKLLPPVLDRGEPDPANDERDAKLEYRNVVPTPEMIAYVQWWDVPEGNTSICFKHLTQKPVVWRRAGDNGDERWQYEDCPQPLKPHGWTWQELDAFLADNNKAELPKCMTCHCCGGTLESIGDNSFICRSGRPCNRGVTGTACDPYAGPCKSPHHARHE